MVLVEEGQAVGRCFSTAFARSIRHHNRRKSCWKNFQLAVRQEDYIVCCRYRCWCGRWCGDRCGDREILNKEALIVGAVGGAICCGRRRWTCYRGEIALSGEPLLRLLLPLAVTLPRKRKADCKFILNLNNYRNSHFQILNQAKQLYSGVVLASLVDAGVGPSFRLSGHLFFVSPCSRQPPGEPMSATRAA